MKRIVSISLGSSKRDHRVQWQYRGETFLIERIGADGDTQKATALIRELDGKVDTFGLGGTDLYLYAGKRRYIFSQSAAIASAARQTPIVDGSGIKNTLERQTVEYLRCQHGFEFAGKRVLMVCAVDRFGLAEALSAAGCRTVFGDLMFGLGLPVPIETLTGLARLASMMAPLVTRLPVSLFYPTGDKQTVNNPRFNNYFQQADIIAGDWHFIHRYMPRELPGKLVITNTVTTEDEQFLRQRGVKTLVTTTPDMGGRSFGTNVLEAVLVALAGKKPEELKADDYTALIQEIGLVPSVRDLV
ncbi:hypothetical protein [Acetonema longum]|uniref:Quinate 5-dehydrogenase n=1 Tax=Acetonema longum DSM 6540 TaxID=1009370 RepID=F7NMR9_9FIRM|nr:hypothetical protein [Acetonema longum]EGO62661.1 hypothetical protein ALO_17001 [Acetonema longum DSM 6540]